MRALCYAMLCHTTVCEVSFSAITDQGVDAVGACPALRRLTLTHCVAVTAPAVAAVEAMRPGLAVTWHGRK